MAGLGRHLLYHIVLRHASQCKTFLNEHRLSLGSDIHILESEVRRELFLPTLPIKDWLSADVKKVFDQCIQDRVNPVLACCWKNMSHKATKVR